MAANSIAVYQQLLVVRSQLGDRAALDELVALWERRLLYYVRRLLPAEDEAQQVMQDVWVKVLTSLPSLRDPARLAPWLYRLTRYTVIDHLRDSYTRRQLLSTEEIDHAAIDDDPVDRFDNAEEIHIGLSQLDVVDREALTLYFLNDMSIAEMQPFLTFRQARSNHASTMPAKRSTASSITNTGPLP